MADTQRDRPLTETRRAQERGPAGHHSRQGDRRSGLATSSVITGGLGAVIALLPGFWTVAFVLAAVALVTGLLVVRQGPAAPGYRTARTGVALGIIAAVLGALNLAIDLEAFDYFSDPDPDPVAD